MARGNPISVAVVEDNRGTRDSVVSVLHEAGLRCVGDYATGEAAIAGIPRHPPEVALIDINLPGISGIELVRQLKAKLPILQVLILTNYEESTLIFDALRAGASGYLLKKTIPEELIAAIEDVHAGGSPMSFHIARKVVTYFHELQHAHRDVQTLTSREHEILTLLAQGYLIKEISDRLGIAFHTARTHLRHIYEKLHVQSRSEAIVKFLGSR
jgi:DNA-binding NarL/FixJ family response regulator